MVSLKGRLLAGVSVKLVADPEAGDAVAATGPALELIVNQLPVTLTAWLNVTVIGAVLLALAVLAAGDVLAIATVGGIALGTAVVKEKSSIPKPSSEPATSKSRQRI